MEAKEFLDKYMSGIYKGAELEIQLEMNLIDIPEYLYKTNYAKLVENTGQACSPKVIVTPLSSIYGDGWLFGPRENANPVPSMLAYWFEKMGRPEDFLPIADACEAPNGEYFVQNADHKILLAFIMGWNSIPLQVTRTEVEIIKSRSETPLRMNKKVKRYSM
jgi:hypothetical protein